MIGFARFGWLALVVVLVCAPGAYADPPSVSANETTAAPVIDGIVDDAPWQAGARGAGFVERKPVLRASPADRTEFIALFDSEALYVAVICHDTQPSAIVGLTRTRDSGALFSDDAVSLKIDAHSDRRTTYGFVVNASGARLDYRGVNESSFRTEFDEVWEAAVRRTDTGWTAEFKIPWQALGIDPNRAPNEMGFNISRDHPRRNATYDWSLMPPPFSPFSASLYGRLTGFGILRGRNISTSARSAMPRVTLTPSLTVGFRRLDKGSGLETDDVFNFSADVDAELGGGIRAALTVNTDFSQVDLDDSVVNLTRFGLFVTEKRDFFLTDLEVFTFGVARRAQLLHTRRIGLHDGKEVPIVAGLKVVGRPTGQLQVGLLQVTTRETTNTDGAIAQPWTSFLAARALLGLGGGSNIGVMLTHRQALETAADHNITVGVDGAYRGRSNPLLVEAFALLSFTGANASSAQSASGGSTRDLGDDGPAPGVGMTMTWRDELVRPTLSYRWLHGDLRTDLGFLQRSDVHQAGADLIIEPRIGRNGIEKVTVETSGGITSNGAATDILDVDAGGSVAVIWDAGYSLKLAGFWAEATVVNPFTVGTDTSIDSGVYGRSNVRLTASTPSVLPVSADVSVVWEQYFGGQLGLVSGSITAKPSALIRFDVGGEYGRSWFSDGNRDFQVGIVNGRVTLGFTPDVGLSTFAGWDYLTERVRFQSRFRYGFLPGSDWFIVYQLDLDLADDPVGLPFQSLLSKWSVRW